MAANHLIDANYRYPDFESWGQPQFAPLGADVRHSFAGTDLVFLGSRVTGRQEVLTIADGVTLHLSRLTFLDDCAFSVQGDAVVTFAFRLCGRSYDRFADAAETLHSGPYFSLARQTGPIQFERRFPKGDQIETLFILGAPDALRQFMDCAEFDAILTASPGAPVAFDLQQHPLTATMCELIGQFGRGEYVGGLRRAFYQAKAKELLCAAIDRMQLVQSSAPMARRRSPRFGESLERARRILDAELAEDHALGDLASRVALSRTSLACGFREHYGVTIGQYVFNARMHRALALLEDPGLTLNDIAERTGYDSAYSLSRAFKRRFGAAPRQISSRVRLRRRIPESDA